MSTDGPSSRHFGPPSAIGGSTTASGSGACRQPALAATEVRARSPPTADPTDAIKKKVPLGRFRACATDGDLGRPNLVDEGLEVRRGAIGVGCVGDAGDAA